MLGGWETWTLLCVYCVYLVGVGCRSTGSGGVRRVRAQGSGAAGRRGGGPLDELAVEPDGGRRVGQGAVDQAPDEPVRHLVVGQAHGGQLRGQVGGDEGQVVEADDGQLGGDAQAQPGGLPVDGGRDLVLEAEDGGGAVRPVQDGPGGGVGAGGGVWAGDDQARIGFQARLGQRPLVTGPLPDRRR